MCVCAWQWLKNFFNKNQLRNFLLLFFRRFFRRFFAAQFTHTLTHISFERVDIVHTDTAVLTQNKQILQTRRNTLYTHDMWLNSAISAQLILLAQYGVHTGPHMTFPSSIHFFLGLVIFRKYFIAVLHRNTSFHMLTEPHTHTHIQYDALISARGKVLS